MADNTSRAVVQRHQFADYLNIGTAAEPNWVLMGVGFTTLDENPGAQTSTKKYVNEKTASTSITSYETQFPFESDLIKSQDAVMALYNVGRNHYTGEDAEFEYVRVELWDQASQEVQGVDTPIENTYAARKFRVACEVSETSGEDDQVVSGNLNAVGDPTFGTFNTSTKTFTEAA